MQPQIIINQESISNGLKIYVTFEDHKILSIENPGLNNVDETTYVTAKVNIDDEVVYEENTQDFGWQTIVNKNIVVYFTPYNSHKFIVDDYTITSEDFYDTVINVTLKVEPTSYCEPINNSNPFLMYYRKLLPYNRYGVYATYKDQISYLGVVDRITYDTVLEQYKLYSQNGSIIYYDKLPLVNPSKAEIKGTNYTNPPTTIWLIDLQNLDDLIFVNQINIDSILLHDDKYSSFQDWLEHFQNPDIYNQFNIKQMIIEVRSLNQRILFDFETYDHLNFDEFILGITQNTIYTMMFPFRNLYFKLEKYRLTRITLKYNDDQYIQIDGHFISSTKEL